MQLLENAGKIGCKMADFSVMMVVVYLGSTTDREDRLIVRSSVTASDSSLSTIRHRNHVYWEPIVFSDESCFQLCPADHRGRVWRSPGQCANPAFNIARHTGPQQGVIVWGAISFDIRMSLVVIRAHLSRRYVDDTLRPVLLLLL
ncbi:transposable element Tc1 transposase [Trichonephila clavipes]|nr:transposable element Tc1 transposase [Trichonephila clavipes]